MNPEEFLAQLEDKRRGFIPNERVSNDGSEKMVLVNTSIHRRTLTVANETILAKRGGLVFITALRLSQYMDQAPGELKRFAIEYWEPRRHGPWKG